MGLKGHSPFFFPFRLFEGVSVNGMGAFDISFKKMIAHRFVIYIRNFD